MTTTLDLAEVLLEEHARGPSLEHLGRDGFTVFEHHGGRRRRRELDASAFPELEDKARRAFARIAAERELERRSRPRRPPKKAEPYSGLANLDLRTTRVRVAEMRARGVSAVDVRRFIHKWSPFTLRQVFAGCSDEFERSCYRAG